MTFARASATTSTWTDERPTLPGLYWFRAGADLRVCAARVIDGRLWAQWLAADDSTRALDGGFHVDKAPDGEWMPLDVPSLFGVEALEPARAPRQLVSLPQLVPVEWVPELRSPLATGSELARVELCPVSALVARGPEDPHRRWADRGHVLHRFLEVATLQGRVAALASMPPDSPYRALAARIDLEELPAGEPEVALAWHPESGRVVELGTRLERDYSGVPREPGWLAGTLDKLLVDPGYASVTDYKTGYYLPVARGNAQLGFGVGAGATLAGADEADAAIFGLLDDGEWRIDGEHYDARALATNRDRMVAIVRSVERAAAALRDGEVHATPGEHCEFCRAAPSCPARWALADAVRARLVAGGLSAAVATMPAEEVGVLVRQLDAIEKLVPAVRLAVRARVQAAPIPLPDGKRLVWERRPRELLDPVETRRVLVQLFGEAVASEAVPLVPPTPETSKERVGDVLAPLRVRVGRRKLVPTLDGRQLHPDDVFAVLRDAGATRDAGYWTEMERDGDAVSDEGQ